MPRRAVTVPVAAMGVALLTVGAFTFSGGDDATPSASAASDSKSASRPTTKVVRRDLVDTVDVTGTVTYGDTIAVRLTGTSSSSGSSTAASSGSGAAGAGANAGAGAGAATTATTAATTSSATTRIITALPAVGTVVRRGQPLYEVNGSVGPVLLAGSRPAWRDLSTSSSDGLDVQQLEENLAAMGFTHGGALVVDDHYNSTTAAAVKDWQEALGVDETGTVAANEIWYGPSEVRVATVSAQLGDSASTTALQVTGTQRRVHVDLDVANRAYVKRGDVLTVTLADGTTTKATVTGLGSTVTTSTSAGSGANAQTTSSSTVALDLRLAASVSSVYDASSVTVALVTSRADNVLAVPTSALLALAEGGYAIELADGGTLVKVTPGKFADGYVEIEGDVSEGQSVVTA